MEKSPRLRTKTATTATLTQWVIENREALTMNPVHSEAVARRFESDTGICATKYGIKQVFIALDVPLARKASIRHRRSATPRLNRLIKEVVLLQEQLCELSKVAGLTLNMSEGLRALKEHKVDPDEFQSE